MAINPVAFSLSFTYDTIGLFSTLVVLLKQLDQESRVIRVMSFNLLLYSQRKGKIFPPVFSTTMTVRMVAVF